MRELSEELYLTRRNFLKLAGAGAVSLASGCLEPIDNYLKQREREERRISLEELEKLEVVDVLYWDKEIGQFYLLETGTHIPISRGLNKPETVAVVKYYDREGYQVFFDEDRVVRDPTEDVIYDERWKSGYIQLPTFSKRLVLRGDDEFKTNVKNMLRVLEEYSPEWYEKTMYAGEVIAPSGSDAASYYGDIDLSRGAVNKMVGSGDIEMILSRNTRFPHEVQHVIDMNVYAYFNLDVKFEGGVPEEKIRSLELELRAGIAEDVYRDEIMKKFGIDLFGPPQRVYKYGRNSYGFSREVFEDDKEKFDQLKYKDRLDKIEQMYFDHENKKLKTDFLDESWQQFKKLNL